MSHNDQNQAQEAYPPPSTAYPAASSVAGPYSAPPPPGYPMRDGQPEPQNHVRPQTQSREDGFWKGCCAALCCCCVLDTCCF